MKKVTVLYNRNDGSLVKDEFYNIDELIAYLQWIKLNSTGVTCIDLDTLRIQSDKEYELVPLS